MQADEGAPAPGASGDLSDPLIGRLLDGRYRIGTRIARGGMASVYEATDTRLDRMVAVKVMHAGLGDDDEFASRFVREARAAARISHPNVVAVYDQGTDDGVVFLAMEYIHGRTLRDVIRAEAPIPPARALALFDPVVAALAAAHREGLVHRDVKPENVLIADDGRIKVVDFGLAKAVSADTQHTAAGGVLIGTVSYVAPELVIEGRADPRADVYAAGVVLYELLTGAKPHEGESPIQVAYKHVHADVGPPSALVPGIPDYVDALVARATARDRTLRFADAAVMLHQLRRVAQALADGLEEDPDLTSDLALPPGAAGAALVAAAADERFADDPGWDEASDEDAHWETVHRDIGGPGALGALGVLGLEAGAQADDVGEGDAAADTGDPLEGLMPDHVEDTFERIVGPDERTTPILAGTAAAAGAAAMATGRSSSLTPLEEPGTVEPLAPEEAPPRRSRRGLVLLVLALLVAALVGVGAWWFGWGRYTTTPALVGLSEQAAVDKVESAGLQAETTTAYSETVAKDEVISSDPEAGSRILDGGTVSLVISRGKERYDVPKLVGLTEDKAQDRIARAHLEFGHSTRQWSEKVHEGHVISSDPVAGKSVKPGTVVDLVISKGRRPIHFANWTGKDADEAAAALSAKGLEVDVSQEEYSDTVPAGAVISQSPATGTLYKGDTVTLVVSRGPELVEIPRRGVIAAGVDSATQTLEDLGFKVKVKEDEAYLGLGFVRRTDPEAGSEVPKGSTITLYII